MSTATIVTIEAPDGAGVQPGCQDATQGSCPRKEDMGWRRVIRNFTPSWFAVNMGTGVVSILLHELPYNAQWLRFISYAFFCANIALFGVFTVITVARYALYPHIWPAMIAHPGQSLFLGCFPMAFATIINMMAMVCGHWGHGFVYLVWAFWWIDVGLSLATCISMPFIVMHQHKPGLQNITAGLLLPIVPTVVAAASGAIIADILPDSGHAFTTVIVSYVLWGIGESFSACVLALYFHRLTIHSLPAKEVIVSVFLPIGPLGQGGFGIQKLGQVALTCFPRINAFSSLESGALRAAEILYVTGVFFGIVMWGFGVVWLAFALVSIVTTKPFPFNMGWWGFTFPIGVLAACTSQLARNLNSEVFKILATVSLAVVSFCDFLLIIMQILSLAVVCLWTVVACRTMMLVYTGEMFFAPCLKDVREKSRIGGCDRRV